MGYYIRVLGIKDCNVPLRLLEEAVASEGLQVTVTADGADSHTWTQAAIEHTDGTAIASVERTPVIQGELGGQEIQEFLEDIQDAQPASAAHWLSRYLPNVKVIYAFQILSGTEVRNGWQAVHIVRETIWRHVGGILQADGEGFSNEEGNHILWQFSDEVDGPWSMAVLDGDGKWVKFEMDLGNRDQRQAFLEGRIPGSVVQPSTRTAWLSLLRKLFSWGPRTK